MDMSTLTAFFMWCTILNGALLILWTVMFMAVPDFVYRIHSKWFPISREAFDITLYALAGGYKIVFLVFNLIPFIALVIVG